MFWMRPVAEETFSFIFFLLSFSFGFNRCHSKPSIFRNWSPGWWVIVGKRILIAVRAVRDGIFRAAFINKWPNFRVNYWKMPERMAFLELMGSEVIGDWSMVTIQNGGAWNGNGSMWHQSAVRLNVFAEWVWLERRRQSEYHFGNYSTLKAIKQILSPNNGLQWQLCVCLSWWLLRHNNEISIGKAIENSWSGPCCGAAHSTCGSNEGFSVIQYVASMFLW